MSNEIAIIESHHLEPWREMPADRKSLLKQVCSGANLTDDQFALLVEVARRTDLDPFRRQIYGLLLGGKFTIVTGIDGFRATGRRHGLAGIDEPQFDYLDPERRIPSSCRVTVYRWGPNGERESYTARRFMRECMRNTPIWKERPHDMLGKCTEAMAHRMAFGESLSGLYERAEIEGDDGRSRPTIRRATTVQEMLAPAPDMIDIEHDPRDKDAP